MSRILRGVGPLSWLFLTSKRCLMYAINDHKKIESNDGRQCCALEVFGFQLLIIGPDRDYRHMTDKTCKLCGPSLAVRHNCRIRVLALHPHVYRSHDNPGAPNIFPNPHQHDVVGRSDIVLSSSYHFTPWLTKLDVPMAISPFKISRASQVSSKLTTAGRGVCKTSTCKRNMREGRNSRAYARLSRATVVLPYRILYVISSPHPA